MAAAVEVARVWGFVKYHHPAYSSPARNADADYFMLLGRVMQHPDSLREVFSAWIAELGPFDKARPADQEKRVVFNDFFCLTHNTRWGQAQTHTDT